MTSTKQDESSSRFRILPPHIVLFSALLALALNRWVPVWILWGYPTKYIGYVFIAVGILGNIYCALEFRRRKTTIIPYRESSALLSDGLYRYSRNPIYLCMVIFLIGIAAVLGSLTPWLVPPLFIWIITSKIILMEEGMLREKFGKQYLDYCKQVRRWI